MIGSVRSNLPSWLGGNKEGTNAEAPKEGEAPSEDAKPDAAAAINATTKNEEEERSSATGSADSNQVKKAPGDELEEDGKAGGAAGEDKISKVKNFGFSLFSSIKDTAATAGSKVGNVKNLIQDLTESTGAKFKKSKLPWEGRGENEEKLKEEILGLSNDRRNFVRAPPAGVTFDYTTEKYGSIAVALLEVDPALGKMRFELVPKIISEENFWRNYFYRVQLLQESFDSPQTKGKNESSDEEAEGKDADDEDLEKELNEMNFEVVEGGKNMENVEKEIQEILDLK